MSQGSALRTPGSVPRPTDPSSQSASPESGPGSGAGLVTQRGSTTISPAAVEKIASRMAGEVPGVAEVALRTGLSRFLPGLSETTSAEPEAQAKVDTEEAFLDLTVAVLYPEPVMQVTERVRQQVIATVRQLTGLEVPEVNIVVPEMVAAERVTPKRRVE